MIKEKTPVSIDRNNKENGAVKHTGSTDANDLLTDRYVKNRMKIKNQTIRERRKINKMIMLESLSNEIN